MAGRGQGDFRTWVRRGLVGRPNGPKEVAKLHVSHGEIGLYSVGLGTVAPDASELKYDVPSSVDVVEAGHR